MTHITASILWPVSLLVCAFLYQKWTAYTTFRAAVIRHGCQRPRKYPHLDPIWGYDLYRERAKATQRGQSMELYMRQFDLHGKTFEEQFFDTKIINTMEAANIQQVAALSFQDWGKSSARNASSSPFLGRGIFSEDGAFWRHSRDLIKPTFARSEISDVNSLGVFVDRLLELIPRDGATIDIQPMIHKLFLDISTDFLFGKSVDSLLPDTPFDSLEFLKNFNESLAGVGRRRRAGMLRFRYMFDRKWKEAYERVHAFVDDHVRRALEETAQDSFSTVSKTVPSVGHTPPHRYILLHEMAKEIRDPIELRFQVLNVFLPARDTTSIAVGNALFHLARNPKVWTDLRNAALSLGSQPLTFEVLKSLVLFKHVLFETLRLQGPSGRVLRTAVRNTVLPVGGGPDGRSPIFVEQGAVVALHLWGLHHDRDIWGNDVDEFKPERWVDKRPMWDFVPFLGGPRICPAQQQVLTQAVYVLVRLVREFSTIENRDPTQEYVELTKMTVESRNGVKIALFPGSSE